jgi:hypothetical protein
VKSIHRQEHPWRHYHHKAIVPNREIIAEKRRFSVSSESYHPPDFLSLPAIYKPPDIRKQIEEGQNLLFKNLDPEIRGHIVSINMIFGIRFTQIVISIVLFNRVRHKTLYV